MNLLSILDLLLGLLDNHGRIGVDIEPVLIDGQLAAPRRILVFVEPEGALVVAQRDLLLVLERQRVVGLQDGALHLRLDLSGLRVAVDDLVVIRVHRLLLVLVMLVMLVA